MAALPCQSVTDSLQDDFLTCGICLEVFTDPRILPCLHTFCFKCLCIHTKSLKSSHRPLLCPECREPFPEENGFAKSNYFINGLTELVKCRTSTVCKCTPCSLRDKTSRAERKCLDCGDFLCSACSLGHNASSQTLGHQIVTLVDLQEGKHDTRLRELQKVMCQQHQDKHVEYFCQTCSQPHCISCVLISHRDHRMQPIAEAVQCIRSVIKEKVQAVHEDFQEISKQENELLSLNNDLESKKEIKERLIKQNAKREIDEVHSRKSVSLKKLTDEMEADQKEQETMLQKVLQQKGVMGSCVDFCDHILEKAKDAELMMMEPMVTRRLQQLKDQRLLSENILQQDDRMVENDEAYTNKQVTSYLKSEETHDGNHNSQTAVRGQLESKGTAKKSVLKFQRKFNTRNKSDLKMPDIKGMAYGLNIGLVLSDLANKKIKVFNSNGELRREITCDMFEPFDVAVAGNIIGSVSENFLLIFTSEGRMKTRIQLNKNKTYESLPFTYSLAAAEHVGFVVGNTPGDNRLRLYGLDGTFTRYVNCRTRPPLASLSVTPAGDVVISEWGSGSLRLLSKEGLDKWRSEKYESGWNPNGNCVSTHGTIFVADYDWGGVCVYSPDGTNTIDHSTACDGLMNPSYVAVDEDGLLFVSDKKGIVNVYRI
ncbi:E3 ubiquitin-protein ligase TRIM33-like [Haliotis rufescens]|uniref:E3 ubiquitin-protein ligase TRIM33-like n=1 Tax=Haliotis rufescens TaxID=6454 RepID=UPI00201EC520|nr:E3 ubiquitin-protein ligase TRIM33-like [Haliotis rufescens]